MSSPLTADVFYPFPIGSPRFFVPYGRRRLQAASFVVGSDKLQPWSIFSLLRLAYPELIILNSQDLITRVFYQQIRCRPPIFGLKYIRHGRPFSARAERCSPLNRIKRNIDPITQLGPSLSCN